MDKQLTLTVTLKTAHVEKMFKAAGLGGQKNKALIAKIIADPAFRRALADDLAWCWAESQSSEEYDAGEAVQGLVPDEYHAQLGMD